MSGNKKQLTVDEAYAQAVEHFSAERYTEADQLCTAIIQTMPEHIDAINLLGVVAQKVNRHDLAVELFQRAITIDNSRALLFYNLATSLHPLGRREEAIKALESAREKEPGNSQISSYLNAILNTTNSSVDIGENQALQKAVEFHQSGKFQEAIICYQKALELNPENLSALSNFGAALQAAGRVDEAVAVYQKAITINPGFVEDHYNLGSAFHEQGLLEEAIASYQKAISIDPDVAEVHSNLGNTLRELGRLDRAVASYQKAIAINPGFQKAHANLGVALLEMKKLTEAAKCCQKAIAINPDYAEAHSNLGNVLREQGLLDEAVASYKKALLINPDFVEAHSNLGNALRDQKKIPQAVASYKKALLINPDFADAHHNLAETYREQGLLKEAITSYKKTVLLNPGFIEAHNNLIFCIDLIFGAETDHFQIERENWNRQFAEPLRDSWLPFKNKADPERKLRIGYVGADFNNHSAAYIFAPVLLNHDPNRFQIFCYAGNKVEDSMTERFKKVATRWLSTLEIDDSALAKRIRQDGIDILIDLSGHTKGNRLLTFARKPAPIQITAWGYPVGTRMAAMDYLFADPIFIPTSQRMGYKEEIIDLTCVVHMNSDISFPEVKPPPACKNGYVTFGSFNRIDKYNNELFLAWSEILHKIPTAKLLIKTPKLDSPLHIAKMKTHFKKIGIAAERLILIGSTTRLEHLKAHEQIDIMLDTIPHNGGTTSLESLRMGVPVLTCEKLSHWPTTASILHVLGLDEWRANDKDDYINSAVKLSSDIQYLKSLRSQMQNRYEKSVLGNSQLYVEKVEAIYRQLWGRWCEGRA
ncbi:MAG: tetratricopeptide repeat protein [Magnetococcales bacterium]|nr:tetratricopeptide repeat protein [Magnetococcales bacterium]